MKSAKLESSKRQLDEITAQYTEIHYTETHYIETHCTETHYTEAHYTEVEKKIPLHRKRYLK